MDHYNTLLEARRHEMASRSLQKLPPNFYPDSHRLIQTMEGAARQAILDGGSSSKTALAMTTLRRARAMLQDVVSERTKKLLLLASVSLDGSGRKLSGGEPPFLAMEERVMWEGAVQLAQTFQTFGMGIIPEPAPSPPPKAPSPPMVVSAPPMPAPPAPPPPPASVVVRIIEDAPPFEVGAETLELRKEEMLTLPADKAQMLVDHHHAVVVTTPAPAPPIRL